MAFALFFGSTFISEKNSFKNLISQTWVIPTYKFQYYLKWRRIAINNYIEEAIVEAEGQGCQAMSLGLLNQEEEVNGHGKAFIEKYPKLKIKLGDGSGLAAAVVLNNIPKGTAQVLFRGELTKVAKAILSVLCRTQIQVVVARQEEYGKIKLHTKETCNLLLSTTYDQKIWLVGDELGKEDQKKAGKGTIFIPYTQSPPKRKRKDCFYHITPAMITPNSLQNLDCCEDWLPRRAMSSWRIAGIIHAIEGWNVNEVGDTVFDIQQVWNASLRHGFLPLSITN